MLHRIYFGKECDQVAIYEKRKLGLLHSYQSLIKYIDHKLDKGCQFGTLAEAIQNPNIIHLTFDDGYVDHIRVARELKQRYSLHREHIHFCINVRNSMKKTKVCTDIFYKLIQNNQYEKIIKCLLNMGYERPVDADKLIENFAMIKDFIFQKDFSEIMNFFHTISNYVPHNDIDELFLKSGQVIELSKHFSIASHAINHVYLDCLNEEIAFNEIKESKKVLENLCDSKVDVFCYPDGRYTELLQHFCIQADYKYALAITPEKPDLNPYAIPRDSNLSI